MMYGEPEKEWSSVIVAATLTEGLKEVLTPLEEQLPSTSVSCTAQYYISCTIPDIRRSFHRLQLRLIIMQSMIIVHRFFTNKFNKLF